MAYLGDAIYEILVRETIVLKGNKATKKLHEDAVKMSRASFQAKASRQIYDFLFEDEKNILKRG
ncbi:MAG: ribonuclease III domain-containing protein, partial [Oscillospiraceae bacterium]